MVAEKTLFSNIPAAPLDLVWSNLYVTMFVIAHVTWKTIQKEEKLDEILS